jgi:hypothetical protein
VCCRRTRFWNASVPVPCKSLQAETNGGGCIMPASATARIPEFDTRVIWSGGKHSLRLAALLHKRPVHTHDAKGLLTLLHIAAGWRRPYVREPFIESSQNRLWNTYVMLWPIQSVVPRNEGRAFASHEGANFMSASCLPPPPPHYSPGGQSRGS